MQNNCNLKCEHEVTGSITYYIISTGCFFFKWCSVKLQTYAIYFGMKIRIPYLMWFTGYKFIFIYTLFCLKGRQNFSNFCVITYIKLLQELVAVNDLIKKLSSSYWQETQFSQIFYDFLLIKATVIHRKPIP